MAYTDALGIACKALGFGADVWWKYEITKYTDQQPEQEIVCTNCGRAIKETLINGKRYSAESIAKASEKRYGQTMCYSCKLAADRQAAETETIQETA